MKHKALHYEYNTALIEIFCCDLCFLDFLSQKLKQLIRIKAMNTAKH